MSAGNHPVNRDRIQHVNQPACVVIVRVRQHDQVDVSDVPFLQVLERPCAWIAPVDQNHFPLGRRKQDRIPYQPRTANIYIVHLDRRGREQPVRHQRRKHQQCEKENNDLDSIGQAHVKP